MTYVNAIGKGKGKGMIIKAKESCRWWREGGGRGEVILSGVWRSDELGMSSVEE